MGNSVTVDRTHFPKSGDPSIDSRFEWIRPIEHGVWEVKHNFIVVDETVRHDLPKLTFIDLDGLAIAQVRGKVTSYDFSVQLCKSDRKYDLTKGLIEDGFFITAETIFNRKVLRYRQLCDSCNGMSLQAKCDVAYALLYDEAVKGGFDIPSKIILDAKSPEEGLLKSLMK